MKSMTTFAALALLTTSALAQAPTSDGKNAEPTPSQSHVVPRDTPKEATPLDKFDLKTTDTGDKVQQRLQLDISRRDEGLFLYGNKTTTYPTARDAGQDFQPAIPQASPKDSYSIGIGVGRRF